MTDHEKEHFRRMMDKAAALPASDARYQEVFRRIAEVGTWAEQYWLELLRQDQKLRLLLRRVRPPEDLQERLLQIPEPRARLRLRVPRRAGMVVVATACLMLLGWLGVSLMQTGQSLTNATRGLAVLTIHDHLKRPDLTIRSADPSDLVSGLGGSVAFPVRIPKFGEDYQLVGGRICKLNTHPLVYTRWQHRGRDHSLYQVSLSDFGLPRGFSRRMVAVGATPAEPVGHRVTLWAEGNCAFALVCEDDEADDGGKHPHL